MCLGQFKRILSEYLGHHQQYNTNSQKLIFTMAVSYFTRLIQI